MKVRWTRRAERSLALIADYIAESDLDGAYRTIMKIRDAGDRLGNSPLMGRDGRVKGTRELVVTPNYILPYRVHENEVHILHVFHAKRRWPENF